MFEQTVANILNQYLGQYVQDLNTDSLNIAVWSGDVVLKNLEIKKDCLDQFRLPISVIKGHVGEVKMTVPWSSLASSPVVLTFNNLFLHVVPQGEIKVTSFPPSLPFHSFPSLLTPFFLSILPFLHI
eukprot:TRINITY_DN4495_c0_g2_i2.p1 TRINITY_DN4495_c0_g2~~TRINITY_DN4495_c0_g2_i2.p1  ORF type:complete len:147 (+),score=27.23 TRINITY_DN4495_c0_g2_i2:61-441(+)